MPNPRISQTNPGGKTERPSRDWEAKMKRTHWFVLSALIVFSAIWATPAMAENLSPVGLWKTVDDKTGEARSFLRIWLDKGELFGKVEKLIRKPGENPNPLCDECSGDKKDKPIMGMTIMWGLKQDGETWSGGHILDPDNGTTYKCRVKIVDGGEKIDVRGYIGFSLLGRSQIWHRAE
jgi:uncharacterized protein (DUF2147 family)